MSFGGGGSSGTTTTTAQPYAPAEPALNQILSEAGTIYGQGPAGAGYVAPSTQTLQGLAAQETIANAANQQILNTIQGQYTNPFLSPLISQAATDIYSNVAGQFSGAGRTPTSPLAQSTVVGQVANKALPLAFSQLERERNRQLQTARAVPSLTAVGGALEDIQAERQLAPQAALSQYYNTVAPIAFGLPVGQTSMTAPRANPITSAAGGAMSGAALAPMLGMGGGMGAAIGAGFGLLGGLL
jgi:hypothetical protein|tara:strand:+ start:54 stop:779 length:726 start_codon:yes stop_codon:yes gene_type:complete